MGIKQYLKELWFAARFDKPCQMAAIGGGMICIGFGFKLAIGIVGIILFYVSWQRD